MKIPALVHTALSILSSFTCANDLVYPSELPPSGAKELRSETRSVFPQVPDSLLVAGMELGLRFKSSQLCSSLHWTKLLQEGGCVHVPAQPVIPASFLPLPHFPLLSSPSSSFRTEQTATRNWVWTRNQRRAKTKRALISKRNPHRFLSMWHEWGGQYTLGSSGLEGLWGGVPVTSGGLDVSH